MAAREVVEAFWAAMRANDWDAAAAHFADGFLVDWPCSGERITSRADYAEIQRRYPAAGGLGGRRPPPRRRGRSRRHRAHRHRRRGLRSRDLHLRGRRRSHRPPARVLAGGIRATGLARGTHRADRPRSLSLVPPTLAWPQ